MGAVLFWLGVGFVITLVLLAAWAVDRRARRMGHHVRHGSGILQRDLGRRPRRRYGWLCVLHGPGSVLDVPVASPQAATEDGPSTTTRPGDSVPRRDDRSTEGVRDRGPEPADPSDTGFELSQGGEDEQVELAAGVVVSIASWRLRNGAAVGQAGDGVDQVAQGAAEGGPVSRRLRCRQGRGLVQDLLEGGPVAQALLAVSVTADVAGALQGVDLEVRLLVGGGDADVAEPTTSTIDLSVDAGDAATQLDRQQFLRHSPVSHHLHRGQPRCFRMCASRGRAGSDRWASTSQRRKPYGGTTPAVWGSPGRVATVYPGEDGSNERRQRPAGARPTISSCVAARAPVTRTDGRSRCGP